MSVQIAIALFTVQGIFGVHFDCLCVISLHITEKNFPFWNDSGMGLNMLKCHTIDNLIAVKTKSLPFQVED